MLVYNVSYLSAPCEQFMGLEEEYENKSPICKLVNIQCVKYTDCQQEFVNKKKDKTGESLTKNYYQFVYLLHFAFIVSIDSSSSTSWHGKSSFLYFW